MISVRNICLLLTLLAFVGWCDGGRKRCGSKTFNTSHQKCCLNKHVVRRSYNCALFYLVRCGNARYNPKNKKCCPAFVITNRNSRCPKCGAAYYNPKVQKCCPGNAIRPIRGSCRCGVHKYDSRKQKCCNNKFVVRRSLACPRCGKEYFDRRTQRCCPAFLVLNKKKACPRCGTSYYNSKTWKCCHHGNVLRPRKGKCPPGKCSLWGDPHYTTIDGRRFDFQGDCRYVLSRDCSGKNSFRIEIEQMKLRPGSTVAYSKSFTIKFGARIIQLDRYLMLKVDGNGFNPPTYSDSDVNIYTSGYTISVSLKKLDIVLTWRANHHAELFVGTSYHGKLCGLCGNFDSDPKNDFTKPNGKRAKSGFEFGNSWKVDGDSSPHCLDDEGKNACDKLTPRVMSKITEFCHNILRSAPFSSCSNDASIKDCETELCDCNGEPSCVCTLLENQVEKCKEKGVTIARNWRQTYNCARSCVHGNKEYKNGITWEVGCNTCECRDEQIVCTKKKKVPTATLR